MKASQILWLLAALAITSSQGEASNLVQGITDASSSLSSDWGVPNQPSYFPSRAPRGTAAPAQTYIGNTTVYPMNIIRTFGMSSPVNWTDPHAQGVLKALLFHETQHAECGHSGSQNPGGCPQGGTSANTLSKNCAELATAYASAQKGCAEATKLAEKLSDPNNNLTPPQIQACIDEATGICDVVRDESNKLNSNPRAVKQCFNQNSNGFNCIGSANCAATLPAPSNPAGPGNGYGYPNGVFDCPTCALFQ